MERDVAVPIGDRRVHQRDVGAQRREQADFTERRLDTRERVVRFHRRPGDRTRHDRGKSARAGFESLGEREERPMLDVHLTAFVGTREHRIRGEVRERVAGISGDDVAHESAAEEQRAQARQRQHDERELRVATPPLTHDFAGRGRPARVAYYRVQHIAGTHVGRHRLAERGAFVVAGKRVVVHSANVVSPGQPP